MSFQPAQDVYLQPTTRSEESLDEQCHILFVGTGSENIYSTFYVSLPSIPNTKNLSTFRGWSSQGQYRSVPIFTGYKSK